MRSVWVDLITEDRRGCRQWAKRVQCVEVALPSRSDLAQHASGRAAGSVKTAACSAASLISGENQASAIWPRRSGPGGVGTRRSRSPRRAPSRCADQRTAAAASENGHEGHRGDGKHE